MTNSPIRNFSFVKDSLSKEEIKGFANWYGLLKMPDKRNVGTFLRQSYDWMASEAEELKARKEDCIAKGYIKQTEDSEQMKGDYFVVNAIGSTARGKKKYGDIDFLMVTNRIWRDMNSFQSGLLEERLSKFFEFKMDPEIDKAYESPLGRPRRTLITLSPLKGLGKKIHLTLQPEIEEESDWNRIDNRPRVPIYRFGDTSGYHDTISAFAKGMEAITQLSELYKAKVGSPQPVAK